MLILILWLVGLVAFALAAGWAVIAGLKGKEEDAAEDIFAGGALAAAGPIILAIVVVGVPFYFFWKLGRRLR